MSELSADRRDRLHEATKDQNAVPLTRAAFSVLERALVAIDETDALWDAPGAPTEADYILGVVCAMSAP